ncbi:MAG: TadE/TadG family type IV pilus assembly protein, partial [Gemmatimonadales bacterium]
MVEFAIVVPIFMVLLLGMLEFGLMINHNMTVATATREGARAGAAMADGSIKDSDCGGATLSAANVDPLIIAALERVLTSPGSMVKLPQISEVRIFKATASGADPGTADNIWRYRSASTSPGSTSNPLVPCLSPAQRLNFYQVSASWGASSRVLGANPDSIGIRITYNYQFTTPLGGILRFFGGQGSASLTMTDSTIMALEPTS